jgi:tetratricopeptide (TPR) repeat protein
MKRLCCLLALGFVNGWILHAQDIPSIATEAEVAYTAGDYNTAIILYESVLDGGVESGALYFNLGSAHYQSGALGQAQLNFRRAQQFIPRDSDLNQAMLVIRQERMDVQVDPTILIDQTALLTTSLLTMREISTIVFLLWVGLVALGLGLLLRPDWRRTLTPFLVVFCVAFVALAGLWGNRAYVDRFRPLGVLPAETNFYSGPSREYLELFQLSQAAELRVVERHDSWGRASLPDGRQGWVVLDEVLFVRER